MSEQLNPSYGSPFAQGARSTSPKEVMYRLRQAHPKADKQEIFRLFKKEANADPELSDICIEIAAINAYTAWEKLVTNIPKNSKEAQQQEQEEVRKQAIDAAARVQSSIRRAAILDFIMPNDKKLRDCTFGEVGKFGKGFTQIARAGKPDQVVGKVLSETKAKALMRS